MKKFKLKEALAIGLPTASLAVSSANFVTNAKKREENKKYQESQINALGRLTDNLDKVNRSLSKVDTSLGKFEGGVSKETPSTPRKRRSRFGFFQKNNSHTLDYAQTGAVLGGGIGAGGVRFLPKKIGGQIEIHRWKDGNKDKTKEVFIDDPNYKYPRLKETYNGLEDSGLRSILLALGGVAVGATLGAIVGAVADVSEAVSRKSTVNARLMKDVLENLRKSGYREDQDYTRNSKKATLLRTKVCLVISKSADTLRLLINTVSDPKLKSLAAQITKNLPAMSTVTEKASDRFNELNITTMTSNNGDATWVSSVAERFISAGYPVYLVEVG